VSSQVLARVEVPLAPNPRARVLTRHEAMRELLQNGALAAMGLPAEHHVAHAAEALQASPVTPLLQGLARRGDLVGEVGTSTDPHVVMLAYTRLHAGAEALLEQARGGDEHARVGAHVLWAMVSEALRIFARLPRS
jgi:hypothetical protein